jgi:hypothetical protein
MALHYDCSSFDDVDGEHGSNDRDNSNTIKPSSFNSIWHLSQVFCGFYKDVVEWWFFVYGTTGAGGGRSKARPRRYEPVSMYAVPSALLSKPECRRGRRGGRRRS